MRRLKRAKTEAEMEVGRDRNERSGQRLRLKRRTENEARRAELGSGLGTAEGDVVGAELGSVLGETLGRQLVQTPTCP